MTSPPRPLNPIIYVTSCLAAVVGVLVLAGWMFDIPALKSVIPGFIAMQPWTAVSFICSAFALALAGSGRPGFQSLSAAPAIAVVLAAGSPLLQYLSGFRFGTDVWLFPTAIVAGQTHGYSDPGRMSQAAGVGLTALAAALLLAPRADGRISRVAFSILGTTALAAATLGLLNYVLRLEPLDAMFLRNPLALHSALTLAALAIGTLALRPDAGWVRIAAEQGPVGWTATILLGTGALLLLFGTDAATRAGTIAADASDAWRRLEILLSTLKDAETGQRGYLLTSRDSDLELFNAARDRLPSEFAAASESLGKVQEQPANLDRLHSLAAAKLTELADTIVHHRAGQAAEALAMVEAGHGQATMDSIRHEVDLLVRAVADDAAARSVRARRIAKVAASGIMAMAGLAFWALAAAGRAQRDAAASLAISAARQRDLLLTLGLGTFVARDLNGIINYWADGCERLYGWTAAEAVGRSAQDLLRTDFPEPVPKIEATLQRTGEWIGDLRQRTRDGRALVVTVHKVLRRAMQGHPAVVLEAVTDVTAQRRAEAALHDSQALLHTIIETTPGLIYAKDADGRMLMANSAAVALIGRPWTEIIGRTDAEFLGDPAQGEAVMATDRRVMQGGQSEEIEELVSEANGQVRVWLSTKTPMRDKGGRLTGLVGVSIDITERKRGEERLHLMVNELNHRVKNTLATVQSIASQTLRGADPAIQRTLEGRLRALAAVHDVLTRESWKEASLHEVVESALAPYGSPAEVRFEIAGVPLRVTPRVAVATSLALHELATNAIKYGALSTPTGKVAISWEIMDNPEPRLRMIWAESGGPPVVTPPSRGFGTRLIERALAQDLGGTARLDFHPGGVTCVIDARLREVASSHETALPRIGPRGPRTSVG